LKPDFDSNAAIYDRLAPLYDAHMSRKPSDTLARTAFLDLVTKNVSLGSTLLDFGCGTGLDAFYYAQRGYRVLAYDHSPGMIAQLRDRCEEAIVSGDITTCSVDYSSFLCHFPFTTWPNAIVSNFAVLNLIRRPRERHVAEEQIASLQIKTPDAETRVVNLSGGNQQKVVLGKWLSMTPKVMILDEPTRGIDVGAKAEIYRLMRELAARGTVILMISSDMEEVLHVSDRVAVMHEGEITGVLDRADCTEENIMQLAVGRKIPAAKAAFANSSEASGVPAAP